MKILVGSNLSYATHGSSTGVLEFGSLERIAVVTNVSGIGLTSSRAVRRPDGRSLGRLVMGTTVIVDIAGIREYDGSGGTQAEGVESSAVVDKIVRRSQGVELSAAPEVDVTVSGRNDITNRARVIDGLFRSPELHALLFGNAPVARTIDILGRILNTFGNGYCSVE